MQPGTTNVDLVYLRITVVEQLSLLFKFQSECELYLLYIAMVIIDSKQPDYSQINYPPTNYGYSNSQYDVSATSATSQQASKDSTQGMFYLCFS